MCLLHDGFPFVTRKPSHPQWPSSEGPNQDQEISRRLEEIDSGKVKLVPAEEVFARIQARLDEAR
jgi:hypothetical protein